MAENQFTRDRDQFGHWLSGFVDGEGYFGLVWLKHKMAAGGRSMMGQFAVCVRSDDDTVIRKIHKYLGVGSICMSRGRPNQPSAKPSIRYEVASFSELHNVIVPQFDRYPLEAKKHRDFLIWKQGVELLYRVNCRKHLSNGRRSFGKATAQERERFGHLVELLKEQRKYTTQSTLDIPHGPIPLFTQKKLDFSSDS